ncbi:hypothetical protein ACFXAZ_12245 [Streptomyces sp. NPDC059477]|uniref:hypothetical protein n=1 Tax=Streptomyces sp. NPDC059477 TaxID=3346847 RepID=UPI0036A808A0
MDELDTGGAQEPLTWEDFTAYRHIAEHGCAPDGYDPHRLIALGLVDRDPYTPGRYIPHDPRAAAQGITAGILRDLERIVGQMRQVPALERLASDFDPHRFYSGPASEFLASAVQMNTKLGELAATAVGELCSVQPGEPADRDPEIVRLGVERTRAALARGVRVRSLYHRSAREHAQTRDYIGRLLADGAEVRASDMPGPRMVLIDCKHLFIDNMVVDGAEDHSGWHVFDRAAVAWGRSLFERFWNHASRWQDLSRIDSPLTERQLRIVRELAAGYSQAQVGPRIGISRSAVDKEVAAARDALGFRTTYQLMAWYGRSQRDGQGED